MGWLLRYLKHEKEEPDGFHTGLVNVHTILLLIQQCFIVDGNPSVAAHSGVGLKGGPPLWCILECSGGVSHFSFPGPKKPLENAWGSLFLPKCYDVWSVIRMLLDVCCGHLGLPLPWGFDWSSVTWVTLKESFRCHHYTTEIKC